MALGIPIVDQILGIVDKGIDKIFPDKTVAEQAKAEIRKEVLGIDRTVIESSARIVLGEIQGQSWLQRNWRPLLMLTAIFIVANNYIVYPYLVLFGIKATELTLPQELWQVMKIGVGGYIVGRSTEKIAESLTGTSIMDRIFGKKNGK